MGMEGSRWHRRNESCWIASWNVRWWATPRVVAARVHFCCPGAGGQAKPWDRAGLWNRGCVHVMRGAVYPVQVNDCCGLPQVKRVSIEELQLESVVGKFSNVEVSLDLGELDKMEKPPNLDREGGTVPYNPGCRSSQPCGSIKNILCHGKCPTR